MVWSSSDPAPAVARVLSFDEEAGLLSFVDTKSVPARVDFRLDNVSIATRTRLTNVESVDGATIYGLTKEGTLLRATPSGDWTFKPPRPARADVPLSDGTVLLIGSREKAAMVWRMRPPDTKILDSAEVPGAARASWAQAGDRLYFIVEHNLVGVRTRDLRPLNVIELDGHALSVVATPSGDRLFAVSDSSKQVDIIDRYREKVVEHIDLPGLAEALRIDPLGRYLLVRAAAGDSAWVIDVGTDHLTGSVRTTWRDDLPFVAVDGAIAVSDGRTWYSSMAARCTSATRHGRCRRLLVWLRVEWLPAARRVARSAGSLSRCRQRGQRRARSRRRQQPSCGRAATSRFNAAARGRQGIHRVVRGAARRAESSRSRRDDSRA